MKDIWTIDDDHSDKEQDEIYHESETNLTEEEEINLISKTLSYKIDLPEESLDMLFLLLKYCEQEAFPLLDKRDYGIINDLMDLLVKSYHPNENNDFYEKIKDSCIYKDDTLILL